MSTTFGLINNLKQIKTNIMTSLMDKGVTVPENSKLENVPRLIDSIETGGGSDFEITEGSYLFYNNNRASQIEEILPFLNLSGSCSYMFASSSNTTDNNITSAHINSIDFSKVTNMDNAFRSTTHTKMNEPIILDIASCTTLNAFTQGYGMKNVPELTLLNSQKVKTWSASIYSGMNSSAAYANKLLEKLTLDMSACTACSNMFHSSTATYSNLPNLKEIDFSGGSFGGSSTTSTLTLDTSKLEGMTKESYINMFNSLGINKNGKTRIFKISQEIYESLSEEEIAIATNKGYSVSY